MKFCKKCQSETARYKNGKCKPCEKFYSAAWRKANPERVIATVKNWIKANSQRFKATALAWVKANPEKRRAATAAYTKANPEARRITEHNRLSRKRANGGVLSKGLSAKLFKLQQGKCPCCKQPLGDDYHLDHRVPIDLGGKNEDWNMQLLRKRCNLQKSAKDPLVFMQSRGFLL